jgi:hypothetical protein
VTTDESLINYYIVRIYAKFVSQTAYDSLSDESSYIFSLYVDRPDPCTMLDCTVNLIINNTNTYLLSSDFTIDASTNIWNQSYFDSFNDTKTEKCLSKLGSYPDR